MLFEVFFQVITTSLAGGYDLALERPDTDRRLKEASKILSPASIATARKRVSSLRAKRVLACKSEN